MGNGKRNIVSALVEAVTRLVVQELPRGDPAADRSGDRQTSTGSRRLAGDLHRSGEILEQASRRLATTISRTGCVDLLPAAAWETDGGRTVAS